MSTETTAKGRGRTGPRQFGMTDRERILAGSLAKKIKEITGRDVSAETVHAVRFSISRWESDPATKQLRSDMDNRLKKQAAQDKRQKALDLLKEAESELADVSEDDEESSYDETDATGDYSDEGDDDGDDVFGDDDDKVQTTF